MHDFRFAFRQLLKSPGFTVVALLTLALCIGANTSMFSIIRAVLLRPLPFAQPDRIVTVQEFNLEKGIESSNVSTSDYLAWREQARSFAPLSAADYLPFSISGDGRRLAERVAGWRATASLFEVYGVRPILGQLYSAANEQPGNDNVLLIRESLWKRMFNSDPDIVGRTVTVNDQPHTIVGVLPDTFDLLDRERFEMWKPLVLDAQASDAATDYHLVVRGRLAPSASMESARAEMSAIARRLAPARPASERGWTIRVISVFQDMVGSYRPGLLTLFAALVVVLLIGCVNLANLILIRAVSRQREIAVRIALGAGPVALIRQLLAESLLLSLGGGALGVLVAAYAMPVLVRFIPSSMPRLGDTTIDLPALAFTSLIALGAGIAVGLLPAWFATHVDPLTSLKRGASRTQSGDQGTGRWRMGLLIAEVAMSFTLLVVAALLLKSFANLRNTDPGFHPENVLNNVVVLPTTRYGSGDAANRFARGVTSANPKAALFFNQLFVGIRKIPGVVSVGSITGLPMYGNSQFTAYRRAHDNPAATADRSIVQDTIGGDYFSTLGIPLKRGRFFKQFDQASGQRVAIINEALAQRDYPGIDPIGENIHIEGGSVPYQIVGVAGNSRQFSLDRVATPEVFTSVAQTATTYAYVVVRANSLNPDLTEAVRGVFASLDPDLPVPQRTLQSTLDLALGPARFEAKLLGGFAAIALLLAIIGVYGLLSYGAAQRSSEFAIRIALGATAGHIVRLIFGDGMKIVVVGLALGAVLSIAAAFILRAQLFQISPLDPGAYLFVALALFGTAALACLIPARRAARVDPIIALRHE